MTNDHELSIDFEITGKDYGCAGAISTKIKEILQDIGVEPLVIRRVAIATFEAEMNVVMYADRATLALNLNPDRISIHIEDQGLGIADIEQAMQEGFSTATDEMREMGFGAGMGLPNIKRNADKFNITSKPGKGTILDIVFLLNQEGQK